MKKTKVAILIMTLVLAIVGSLSCSDSYDWSIDGAATDYRIDGQAGTLYFDNGEVVVIYRNWSDETAILLNHQGVWNFTTHEAPFGTNLQSVEYRELVCTSAYGNITEIYIDGSGSRDTLTFYNSGNTTTVGDFEMPVVSPEVEAARDRLFKSLGYE